eukprot:1553201-Prymnesium_polylepis.2
MAPRGGHRMRCDRWTIAERQESKVSMCDVLHSGSERGSRTRGFFELVRNTQGNGDPADESCCVRVIMVVW